jgi:hypothetical protein
MYHATGTAAYFRATDFRAFYAAGQIVAAGRGGQLYNLQEQYTWQAAAAGLNDPLQLLVFINPPFAALPFALLGRLPLDWAYGVWTFVNLAILVLIGVLLSGPLRHARSTVQVAAVVLSLTFMPVVVTIVQGQWSLLLTAGLLLSWRAFRKDKDLQAGLWLGVLAVKPQLILLPLVALLWQRRWRSVIGLMVSCGITLGLSLAVTGGHGLIEYARLLAAATGWGDRYGIHPQAMYTVRGLAHALLGTNDPNRTLPIWAAGCFLVLSLVWYGWRHAGKVDDAGQSMRWAMLVIAMLLLSPHAYSHDLSLLIVTGALIVSALAEAPTREPINGVLAVLTPLGYGILSLMILLNFPWRIHAIVIFLILVLIVLAARAGKVGTTK